MTLYTNILKKKVQRLHLSVVVGLSVGLEDLHDLVASVTLKPPRPRHPRQLLVENKRKTSQVRCHYWVYGNCWFLSWKWLLGEDII